MCCDRTHTGGARPVRCVASPLDALAIRAWQHGPSPRVLRVTLLAMIGKEPCAMPTRGVSMGNQIIHVLEGRVARHLDRDTVDAHHTSTELSGSTSTK